MNDILEISGIGIFYKGQGAFFSDPENEQQAEQLRVQASNTIEEISVGYNDDNLE